MGSKESRFKQGVGSLTVILLFVDMQDLKKLAKAQDAPEANDLNQWDINFWGERLRELKYDINEVCHTHSLSLSLCVSLALALCTWRGNEKC